MSIAIISASLRPDNNSFRIAEQYHKLLQKIGVSASIIDLKELPHDIMHAMATSDFSLSPEFGKFFEEKIVPINHFIWVLPEYNGSFPASAKLLIDAGDIKNGYHEKHHLLTGVATGRAGNLRGMDHFTSVLHHVKGKVHWDKLPISVVHTLFSDTDEFDPNTFSRMEQQVADFLSTYPIAK